MLSDKEKNFVSAVVYIYSFNSRIEEHISMINKVFYSNFEKYEIICVNDNPMEVSTGNIKLFAKTLEGASVTLVNMGYSQGVELAMNAGIDAAIGDYIFEFDDILMMDYNETLIMKLYKREMEGYDIVSATPKSRGDISSRLFYKIFNIYSNTQYKLNTESFRIISRRAVNRVHSMGKTIPYRKALYSNCGLRLDVIKYNSITKNKKIKDKTQKKHREELAIDSLILFTDIAYKISISMIVAMMLTTIASAAYACYVFFNKEPIEGWTTTILFLSLSFFGVFLILAVVIKYLSILVNLVFKKQKYVIESVVKIND